MSRGKELQTDNPSAMLLGIGVRVALVHSLKNRPTYVRRPTKRYSYLRWECNRPNFILNILSFRLKNNYPYYCILPLTRINLIKQKTIVSVSH